VRSRKEVDSSGNPVPTSAERRKRLIGEAIARTEEQGARAWARKHLHDGCDPEWHKRWENTLPSIGCKCRQSYREIKKKLPPRFGSPEEYFVWGHEIHNLVNEKRGVGTISLERARMLWRHTRPNTNNTRLVITIATGKQCRALHKMTGVLMQSYAKRCGADFIVLDNMTSDWWGHEKFRVRHFAQQYEETLFLDVDTIIHPDCESIFGSDHPLMLHDDLNGLRRTDWISAERQAVFENRPYIDSDTCLNSGVVYCHRSHADVWLPAEITATTHCAEQFVVEQNALRLGYCPMDRKWNWQWYFDGFESGIRDAKIIHLSTCPDKLATASRIIAQFASQPSC
jgi:hypothetical protein